MSLTTSQCSNDPLQCLSVAPGNVSGWEELPLSTPWCHKGHVIDRWVYRYESCSPLHISKYTYRISYYQLETKYKLFCDCIDGVMSALDRCLPYQDNQICTSIFSAFILIQLLASILGILSNSIIIIIFARNNSIRSKIPNVLLFHQAVADITNCILVTLPHAIVIFYKTLNKTQLPEYEYAYKTGTILSLTSSVLMHLLIATDRWLSVFKPLWHRAHVGKGHILSAVGLIWALSIVFSVIKGIFKESGLYTIIASGSLGLVIVIVMILLLFTFFKTFLYIRSKSNQEESTRNGENKKNHMYLKKQFRLNRLFLLMMFCVFFISFICIPIVHMKPRNIYSAMIELFYTPFYLSSTINPMLTFILKRDQFKFQR